ncbi:helix-turn-helix transcriptional regulator [Streptomyces sp. NPDC005805]|uniref:helix-turn-helix domain-containing protein n=1 Tax=Streptomyces sp. NPDC005805 TaxID=3157068 RepID=UPI003410D205
MADGTARTDGGGSVGGGDGADRDARVAGRAFAERLDALRAGSGRSYGSLARRVGLGAATLHRYCTGRTVPMEFAPVERLARFCGCAGAEIVELHRLWLLADEDRRRRMEPGTSKAQAALVAGRGSQETNTVAVGGPGDTDAGGGRGRDEPSGEAVPATSLAPAAAWVLPRPGRRLRKPVALALAVAAVPAALGLVAGVRHLAAGQGGEVALRPGTPPPAGAPAPPTGPAPSASPSPGTRTAPPPADGERRAPGKGGAAGSPDAGPVPGPSAAGPAVPLTWTADDHVWQNGCDHAYLLGRSPGSVPPPPVAADAASWAGALGAVHGGRTMVRVTLQGKGARAVVVEGVDVRVVRRQGPRPLGAYRMSAGCGGALTPRLFDVDLDRQRPVARPRAGNDSGVPLPAVSFPYAVSATEPESLLVSARTVACDCSWYLEVRWSSGGRGGTVRVDDGGRPFRTGGTGGGAAYDYDYVRRAWVADTPGRADGSPEPDGTDGTRDGDGADGTGGLADGG